LGLAMAQTRTFYLENQCSNTVWFTMTSGAAPYAPGKTRCATNTDCVQGATCDTGNGICFWTIPTPANGNFRLDANGGTNSVVFPFTSQNTVWSGNIGGCLNGTCSASENVCDQSGCGTFGGSPQTNAEFTLSAKGIDFYDVEVINGFNLPVAVYPQAKSTNTNPYFCGSPGSPIALTDTANCSWTFNIPSPYYNWVQAGGSACTSNSNCNSGQVCGVSNNVGQNPRFKLTCGILEGHWTANQICGICSTFGAPFDCSTNLPPPNSGNTLRDLYGCAGGIPSCYQNGASDNCCGCADWGKYGMFVPPETALCVNSNPNWMSDVFPGLVFFKSACPSVYTYPFDDMSSTFVCSDMQGSNNIVNYKIVWCPTESTKPFKILKI